MRQCFPRMGPTALVVCMAVFAAGPASSQTSGDTLDTAAATPPRLILQITVDALRGDLPGRYAHLFGDGGFRYLMDKGVHYTNAHYQHANTETIVGHVSLATGTVPAAHGMVGNVWFDREDGRLVYNIEDPDYRLLTAGADVDRDTEIDPTQKAAKVDGRSPATILTSTFSDELAVHTNGKSKIFAVSVKDRGAVSLAGHAGKAFWFSKAGGEFVTSSYYYDEYPEWVKAWNADKPAQAYAGKSWELMQDPSKYLFGDSDDREYETDFPGFGRTFPHPYGEADDKYFTTRLTLSPAGDELTLDFAKALLDNEGLGQDEVPDYLAVSFSSTDYVGHVFGASSLESEDNLARLDRTLAELFAYVDEKVGLENTLIVLSADHGQPEIPGHLHELGIYNAHYFDTDALDKAPAIAALKERFGLGEELIEAYYQPYLYLNRDLIREKGLDQAEVEQAVAERTGEVRRRGDRGLQHRAAHGQPARYPVDARHPAQLPSQALRRHLRRVRAERIHHRLRRSHGGLDPRLALALRHLRAGDVCRRRTEGRGRQPPDHTVRRRTDASAPPRRQAAFGLDWQSAG